MSLLTCGAGLTTSWVGVLDRGVAFIGSLILVQEDVECTGPSKGGAEPTVRTEVKGCITGKVNGCGAGQTAGLAVFTDITLEQ